MGTVYSYLVTTITSQEPVIPDDCPLIACGLRGNITDVSKQFMILMNHCRKQDNLEQLSYPICVAMVLYVTKSMLI